MTRPILVYWGIRIIVAVKGLPPTKVQGFFNPLSVAGIYPFHWQKVVFL